MWIHGIAILAAGFQQQDGGLAIGGQPVGQHAAGRTGADDDEVEFLAGSHDVPHWSVLIIGPGAATLIEHELRGGNTCGATTVGEHPGGRRQPRQREAEEAIVAFPSNRLS